MYSLFEQSLNDGSQSPPHPAPSVLGNLSRNPSGRGAHPHQFDPSVVDSTRPTPTSERSFLLSGLFSGATTLRSNDPLENVKKVESISSQNFPQAGGVSVRPSMRLPSTFHSKLQSPIVPNSKISPTPITSNRDPASLLDSLLMPNENNSFFETRNHTMVAPSSHSLPNKPPNIVVRPPSQSTFNSRAASELPSSKPPPTLQTAPSNKGITQRSSQHPSKDASWKLLETSHLLDELYFNVSTQHILDFGDTVGNTDKHGNILAPNAVRDAILPTRSSEAGSLYNLQSRLLHQLHIIDLPDLEKARLQNDVESSTSSNNFIIRSILNSRNAQNTELLPVQVGGDKGQFQAFSCGYCGLGKKGGEPAMLLLDARYHGPSERVDHCPNCGMYQGA